MEHDEPVLAEPAMPGTAEARDLCRPLILAEPTIQLAKIEAANERLGLTVTRSLFSAIHREITGTARGDALPDWTGEAAPAALPVDHALERMRRGTSSLDSPVRFLTAPRDPEDARSSFRPPRRI